VEEEVHVAENSVNIRMSGILFLQLDETLSGLLPLAVMIMGHTLRMEELRG